MSPMAPFPAPQPVPPANPWQAQQDAVRDTVRRARRAFSRIGAGIAVTMCVWLAVTLGLQSFAMYLLGTQQLSSWLALLINDVVLYCIAVPLGVVILGSVQMVPVRRFRMSAGRFCCLLVMCVPIMYAGSILGNVLAALLSSGTSSNRIEGIVTGGDWVMTGIAMVILAPIVEEWLFRKQVISRLRRYGEKTAIVVSALMFALFHLNLYQFFYAFGLGLMFGYVYMRTSALRYSVAMHMAVNAVGGLLAPWLLSRVEATGGLDDGEVTAAQAGPLLGLVLFGLVMVCLFIAGLVLLIVQRRSFVFYQAPMQLPRGSAAGAVLGNPGIIVFLVLGTLGTLASVFL